MYAGSLTNDQSAMCIKQVHFACSLMTNGDSHLVFCVWLLQHSHMSDEIVQLKTLQTALTILQSQLHPIDEVR
jgi:hypothetical protein